MIWQPGEEENCDYHNYSFLRSFSVTSVAHCIGLSDFENNCRVTENDNCQGYYVAEHNFRGQEPARLAHFGKAPHTVLESGSEIGQNNQKAV